MDAVIDLTCPVKDVTQSHAGRSLKHSQTVNAISVQMKTISRDA